MNARNQANRAARRAAKAERKLAKSEAKLIKAQAKLQARRAKTEAKQSLRTEAETVAVADTADRLALLAFAQADVMDAGKIRDLSTAESDEFEVQVALVPD